MRKPISHPNPRVLFVECVTAYAGRLCKRSLYVLPMRNLLGVKRVRTPLLIANDMVERQTEIQSTAYQEVRRPVNLYVDLAAKESSRKLPVPVSVIETEPPPTATLERFDPRKENLHLSC